MRNISNEEQEKLFLEEMYKALCEIQPILNKDGLIEEIEKEKLRLNDIKNELSIHQEMVERIKNAPSPTDTLG